MKSPEFDALERRIEELTRELRLLVRRHTFWLFHGRPPANDDELAPRRYP